MKRLAPQVGFTLLELLAAMTLLGMVLALLFQGFRMGGDVWRAGESRLRQWQRGAVVLNLMARQLGAAFFPSGGLYVQSPVFHGEATKIVFYAKTPPPFRDDPAVELRRIGYAVTPDANGRPTLRYCETAPNLPRPITEGLPPVGEWRVLRGGLENLRFSYLADRPVSGEGFQWIAPFPAPNPERVPAAVRVRCRWNGEVLSLILPLRGAWKT